MNYRRVLLKLSGESLGGSFGSKEGAILDKSAFDTVTFGIRDLLKKGIQVGVVIGGGNIFRGVDGKALLLDRIVADQMGMMATIINAMALREALRHEKIEAEVMSSFACTVVGTFCAELAKKWLEAGKVVIFAGGTGNPFFTTDTAASLRAAEIHADIVMKATKVDGVYSKDPKKYKDAVRYETISYEEVLRQKIEVMDATSITLCMTNRIPILVFNMDQKEFSKVLENPKLGTYVHS